MPEGKGRKHREQDGRKTPRDELRELADKYLFRRRLSEAPAIIPNYETPQFIDKRGLKY